MQWTMVFCVGAALLLGACRSKGLPLDRDDEQHDLAFACPKDWSTLEGKPCSGSGLSCGGEHCTNECDWCNVITCIDGKWQGLEAFPRPGCNACEIPGGYCDPGDYVKPNCKSGFHEDGAILEANPGICGLGICCVPD